MRKLLFLLISLYNITTSAQVWQPILESDHNQLSFGGGGSYTSIALDDNGNTYVVYQDGANSNKATVRKYSGNHWAPVGNAGFSSGTVYDTDIAIDGSGTPYVVYRDGGNSDKATVMKYNGSSWVTVGSAGFSAGMAWYTKIAIDGSGTPYVVYRDFGNSQKATVMKYNGSNWVNVGSAGFSVGIANYTSIAIDGSNTPYVVYGENNATVMKYNGSSWVNVGSAGFSAGTAVYTEIAIDGSDVPYVVYRDNSNSQKATVMKYDGSSWVNVGSAGFSAGLASYTSIAIDGSNTPYVVYQDLANSNKATVMKYNGSSWVTVGSAGFSYGTASYTDIAIDGNNTPYVVYSDATMGPLVKKYNGSSWETAGSDGLSAGQANNWYNKSIAIDGSGTPYVVFTDYNNSQKATVMKYNGSSWVLVGSAGFSAGTATFASIAIDGSNTPYVVYQDWANSDKATVMKYNGSSWVLVGSAGFSAGLAIYTSLAIDGSGAPYVAYQDGGNSNRATVMKYNGSSWANVGSVGFSAGAADYTSIAIDGSNTPYVVYRDGGNSNRATVMKYNGSSWVTVGSAGFSAATASYTSIAIDGSGTPYVAYVDAVNGKATVKKFNGSSWVNVGSAGFSPSNASFTSIAIDDNDTPYVVYRDYNNSQKASVMKYDGSSWVNVGSAGFSAGVVYNTSIAIDGSGMPYVAFNYLSQGIWVYKFDLNTWTGSLDTTWSNNYNWSGYVIPGATDSVIIADVSAGSNLYPTIVTAASVKSIDIKSGATLNINPNHSLTLTSKLTNNGTITVRSGGSLVQSNGSILAGSGTYIVQRDITAGQRFIGSPIDNHSVSGFGIAPSGTNGGQIIPVTNPLYRCNADSVSATSPYGNILELIENAAVIDNCAQSLWHVKSTGNLTNARGYAVNASANTTLSFTGKVNNDVRNYSLLGRQSGTLDQWNGNNTTTRGWHLVSNPYPSPITFTNGSLGGSFDNQIQLFDGSSFIPFTLSGGPVTVAVGQGFQIRVATVGGSGTFTVNNAMRVAGNPTFYRQQSPFSQYLDITLSNSEYSDKSTLYFEADATPAFDSKYDANRLFGAPNIPLLYTKETNGEYLAYNALPLLESGSTQTVPVGVYDGATPGEFTLSFEGISTLNATVILEDLKLNTIQSVSEGSTYTFTTQAGDSRDRFLLHFSADISTGSTPLSLGEGLGVRLFPNPTTGITSLVFTENHGFSRAVITDVSGRIVQQYDLNANENIQALNTAELNNGIYFIQLIGSSNNQTLKLIKQ